MQKIATCLDNEEEKVKSNAAGATTASVVQLQLPVLKIRHFFKLETEGRQVLQ